jgi:hypothetical protein
MNDDNRPFPIQRDRDWNKEREMEDHPSCTIPWWLAEEAYTWYSKCFGTGQSLQRLADRGGFGRKELLMLLRKERL